MEESEKSVSLAEGLGRLYRVLSTGIAVRKNNVLYASQATQRSSFLSLISLHATQLDTPVGQTTAVVPLTDVQYFTHFPIGSFSAAPPSHPPHSTSFKSPQPNRTSSEMFSIKSIAAFAMAALVVVLAVPAHAEEQATLGQRVDTSSTRLLRARIMYGFVNDTPIPAASVVPAPTATTTTTTTTSAQAATVGAAPVEPARAGHFRARIVDRLLVGKQD